MNQLGVTIVGGVLMWGLDKLIERRRGAGEVAGAAGQSPPRRLPEPPQFTQEQVRTFAHRQGATEVLEFDRFVVDNLLPETLRLRSAVPLVQGEVPELEQVGVPWRVMPLDAALPVAWDVMSRELSRPGAVVLGSHSLVLLPSGRDVPAVFVVGRAGAQAYAREGGHFAVVPATVRAEVPEAPRKVSAAEVRESVRADLASPDVQPEKVEVKVDLARVEKAAKRVNGAASKPAPPTVATAEGGDREGAA